MTYDLQQLNFKVNIQSKKKRYSYNFYINPKQFTYDSLKVKKKYLHFLFFSRVYAFSKTQHQPPITVLF